MYEIGRAYRWRNMVGDLGHLNGHETTVTGPMQHWASMSGGVFQGQPTDTETPCGAGYVAAEPGDLAPIDPPAGERLVLEMFEMGALGLVRSA